MFLSMMFRTMAARVRSALRHVRQRLDQAFGTEELAEESLDESRREHDYVLMMDVLRY
jgi:hypothetical protein